MRMWTRNLAIVVATFVLSLLPMTAMAGTNPVVESVSPTSGTISGGLRVTITGASFLPGAMVYVGGVPAQDIVVVDSTKITATTPRGTLGPAGVQVVNADGGAYTLPGSFYYVDATQPLTVTGISPSNGPIRGGTLVTITGTGFSGSTVTFGNAPATNVTVLGNSMITARVPAGLLGAVTLTVRNSTGEATSLKNAFTYSDGALEVTAVSPLGGLAAGGTAVQISGNGFASGSRVIFGDVPASAVTVINPTLIVATAPPHSAGSVAITVTTPSGSSAAAATAFTYRASAAAAGLTLTSVSPASGAAVGGNIVTLSGTGFSGGAQVLFGSIPGTDVSSPGPSLLTVRVPANGAGPSAITVVNSDGSSVTLGNGYTYEGASGFAVTAVSQSTVAGNGTLLILTGSRFATGAIVTVNGVTASDIWVLGDSQIYATAPVVSPGTATVTVVNPGGLSASLPGGLVIAGSTAAPSPSPTPTVTPAAAPPTVSLPARGFGLIVFGGGTSSQLASASGCAATTLSFWSTNATGDFDVYVPATRVEAVNAAWNARFASGIPASTPLIGRCLP